MRLLAFILVFHSAMTFAQEKELFNKSNSGLIDNDLSSIAIDKKGNKWIGTSKYGVQKFDGQTFSTFNNKNSKIKGNYIAPIFVDSKGDVWVSFSNPSEGIARYDGSVWTVFTKKDLGAAQLSVIAICEDTSGTLYFGGINGVVTYKNNTWSRLQLPIADVIVRAIDVSQHGSIAVAHNTGLLIYNGKGWESYTEQNSDLKLATVRAVKFMSNGDLLVGYGGGFGDGGLSIISNDKWSHWNKLNSAMPDHMVRDIEIDVNQTIWLSTNNGVVKIKEGKIVPIFFRDGIYSNVILDIACENEAIWIATNFGLIKYVP